MNREKERLSAIPDYLNYHLKIVFIGFNPGLTSAEVGHHYANRSNRFWKLLAESGLTPTKYQPAEEYKLLKLGFGLTNIVSRPTARANEIAKEEYETGRIILSHKLKRYQPRFACYTGIGVYRQFSGKRNVERGLQAENQVNGVQDFVISSPSGLNRTPYQEQLARYKELKTLITE